MLPLLACLTLLGCDTARGRPDADATATDAPYASNCTLCHGEGDDPAPPRALNGATTTDDRGVGAHRIHLSDSAITLPMACSSCHLVPIGTYDDGHLDMEESVRAEVIFSGGAVLNGAKPTYDAENLTCAGTWCHGGAANYGGDFTTPIWNVVDGSQRACNACHGAPPPKPHPPGQACEQCHASVAGPGGTIIERALHIDGKVQVALGPKPPCAGCHEDPPTKNHPAEEHAKKCELCHATSVGPDRKLLAGGTHRDGNIDFALATDNCATCHGAPPTANDHPKMGNCAPCHSKTVGKGGKLLQPGGHVNGKLEMLLPTACDACHGGKDGMPPPDHNGKTDPTLRSVGAHAAHVNGKTASGGGIACTTCHQMPAAVDTPGHLTGTLNTVVFPGGGGLATHKGTAPSWDEKTGRCSDVYCHGATMDGPKNPSPRWNDVDYGCDACHGNPPGAISGHPPTNPGGGTKACQPCHSKTIDKDGKLRTDTGAHVNGWVAK